MKPISLFILLFFTISATAQSAKPDLKGLKMKQVEDEYFGIKRRYYDQRDSLVYEICYDSKGAIITGSYGVAIDQHVYDAKGDRVITRYFDDKMKPMRSDGGPAVIKRVFDQQHRMVEEGFYDENEKLLKSNFSVMQYKYNAHGQLIEKTDLNERRVPSGKVPIEKYKYDEKGRRIEEVFYDGSNKIIQTGKDNEYSIVRMEYSDENKVIKKMFYNESMSLIDGKAIVKIAYNKKPPGRTSVDAYDPNPQWIQYTYCDKNGNEIEQDYEYVPSGR